MNDLFQINDIVVLKTKTDPNHYIGVVEEGLSGALSSLVKITVWDYINLKMHSGMVFHRDDLTVIGSLADLGITEVGW